MKNTFWTGVLILTLLFATGNPVHAVTIPSFPVCTSPQGDIKVSYSEGTHGIVGSTETYTGRDAVYTLSQDTLTQCFCSTDGNGIQTNWWNAFSLSEDQVNTLKKKDGFMCLQVAFGA